MIARLQKKYALSRQGAMDLIKGCAACVFQNITFMIPAGLLYMLVRDLLGGGVSGARTAFYIAGCVVCVGLILLGSSITPPISQLIRKAVSAELRLRKNCGKYRSLFSGKKTLRT